MTRTQKIAAITATIQNGTYPYARYLDVCLDNIAKDIGADLFEDEAEGLRDALREHQPSISLSHFRACWIAETLGGAAEHVEEVHVCRGLAHAMKFQQNLLNEKIANARTPNQKVD